MCVHRPGTVAAVNIGTPLAAEMESQAPNTAPTGCGGENLWLVLQRWKKLTRDFYHRRKDEVCRLEQGNWEKVRERDAETESERRRVENNRREGECE